MASGRCFQARRAEGAVVVGGSSSPCGCGGRGRVGERHEAQVEKAAAMLGGRRGTFSLIIPYPPTPPVYRPLRAPADGEGEGGHAPADGTVGHAPFDRGHAPSPGSQSRDAARTRPFVAGGGACSATPPML